MDAQWKLTLAMRSVGSSQIDCREKLLMSYYRRQRGKLQQYTEILKGVYSITVRPVPCR